MERPNAYAGRENYIFVSYSHKDSEKVEPVILKMQQTGYRVWYDESIHPGVKWDDDIAKHVEGCTCFYAYINSNYVSSTHCMAELEHALHDGKKNMLLIYLEETVLPSGVSMYCNRIQAIYKCRLSDDTFYQKLYLAEGIEGCLETAFGAGEETGKQEKNPENEATKYKVLKRRIEKSAKNGRGPERPRYTKQDVIEYAVFNSVKDNNIWGNEGRFVRVAEKKQRALFGSSLMFETGKKYEILVFFNNNASAEYNDKAHGYAGVARDVRLSVDFPDVLMKDERGEITAKISASNAVPKVVWDGVYITAKEDMVLNYMVDSVRIYNDWDTSEQVLPADLFSENGTLLGLMELDGEIPGGGQHSGYVVIGIEARAMKGDEQQYQSGLKYMQGIGVEKDIIEAAEWYEKAAEQGNVYA